MRNWPFSLQFRLIASFVLVLALTLSAVSWFVSTAFEAEAEQQQHEREDVRAARVQATFAAYFDAHGSWEGVEPVLEQASFLYGWRIVLSDNHGRVLGDSHGQEALRAGEEHEQKASESGEEHEPSSTVGMPVLSDGEKVGSLRFILDGPPSGESHEEPSESDLITRVNRSLIWTGLAVGGAGVLLIAFISRRVLLPIRSLSAAAVRFGKGDLSQRVAPATRDDVGQLGETFNAMAEELQRTELQRRNLMADIAHELRTPLANVQGYVEAIGDGVLQADETTIETLHRQIAHLTGVVEDLRLLTLAEAGALPLYPQPHGTNDILAAAEAAFPPPSGERRHHHRGAPLRLTVDAPRRPEPGRPGHPQPRGERHPAHAVRRPRDAVDCPCLRNGADNRRRFRPGDSPGVSPTSVRPFLPRRPVPRQSNGRRRPRSVYCKTTGRGARRTSVGRKHA